MRIGVVDFSEPFDFCEFLRMDNPSVTRFHHTLSLDQLVGLVETGS